MLTHWPILVTCRCVTPLQQLPLPVAHLFHPLPIPSALSQRIRASLPSLKNDVYIDEYSHLDFVWAMDANERVYKPLMQHMRDAAKLAGAFFSPSHLRGASTEVV